MTLLDDNLPLARIVAGQMYRRLFGNDFAAVYSDALSGLAEASEKYDPTHDVKFVTYANTIIRQRIIDGWRTRYGREMTSARRDQLKNLSLEYEYTDSRGEIFTLGDFRVADGPDQIQQVDDRSECEWLLARLPARNAKILWDHCALGIPLATIGRREGLTESRICQIVDESKRRLKDVAAALAT